MNLNELKKAWNKVSVDAANQELSENKIREILGKRTSSLMDRIDKNIRLGLLILFLVIVAMYIWDMTIRSSNDAVSVPANIPDWVTIMDQGVNLLLILLFVLFFYSYNKVRRQCSTSCNLRQTLTKIIGILSFYRRLFTFALFIFLLSSGTGFIAGYYTGVLSYDTGVRMQPLTLLIGIVFLVLLTIALYFLFRFIFRKLYGNYIHQLKDTLAELDEL